MSYEKELTHNLMREIGLYVDENQCIADQDTGAVLNYNGKAMVYEGKKSNSSIPFDPVGNVKMMNHLFGYYAGKLSQEETDKDITIFYQVKDSDDLSHIEAKLHNGEIVSSEQYKTDSLKYADLIFKLNGSPKDLSDIDSALNKERQKRMKSSQKKRVNRV